MSVMREQCECGTGDPGDLGVVSTYLMKTARTTDGVKAPMATGVMTVKQIKRSALNCT